MTGEKATVYNTNIGTTLKITKGFKPSGRADNFIKKYPKVSYVKITSFHPSAPDVVRVDGYDINGNLIKVNEGDYLCIGYSGDYDAELFNENDKYIDEMFVNLDKLADKIK